MNDTFKKFGWPRTKVFELDHWGVMIRPAQPVFGALVLACKQPVRAFSDVDQAGFAELQEAVQNIERMLSTAVQYEKINYLMLMMVDPDVHFHVLPRYEGHRKWQGLTFKDSGWPGPADLGAAIKLDDTQQKDMAALFRTHLDSL